MKIATWNLQGHYVGAGQELSSLNAAMSIMRNNNIDAFCMQEVGNLTGERDLFHGYDQYNLVPLFDHNIGTQSRPFYVNLIYMPFGNGNLRCSMLTMIKSNLMNNRWAPPSVYHEDGRRLSVGILCNGFWVYNVHAPASGGARQYDVNLINHAIANYGRFIIAGDLNYDITQKFQDLGVNCRTTSQATHQHGNILDGFVTNMDCSNAQFANAYGFSCWVNSFSFSDHKPLIVECYI